MTACFSVLASGRYLDATFTSENILRKSSNDAIIFKCTNYMDASLVLENLFNRSRNLPII